MTTFLAFTTVGIVVGCIYALTATGLVVTYMTSGIFNFAHGALGMVAAFAYWQLTVDWGWPVWLGLPVVLLVLAPLVGVVVERLLMRPLQGAPADLAIVVTLGLLLFLIGLANLLWSPTQTRTLPQFLDGWEPLQLGSLAVTWNQVVVVLVALVVAGALRLLFARTRIGVAMRAVVDDPDLAAMSGASPVRIQQLSWALGTSLAGLAGILLAPLVTLEIFTLTLLVINGYAAALLGRLRSLPATAGGALALGLTVTYAVGYLDPGGFLSTVQPVIPMVFLFVALVLLPSPRLRTASAPGGAQPTVPGLRASLVWAGALVLAVAVLAPVLSRSALVTGGRTFALGIALLSLVLLTGYGGQVSLAHLTFVGLGAYAMGSVGDGGSWGGLLAAVLLAATAGALVALPTLRLRGLYLALATFAFAQAMYLVFFTKRLGSGGSFPVGRVDLPLVDLRTDQAYVVFTAVVFAACAVGLLALRRGRYGRQLAALDDSPAACATLGLNIVWTKLVVFTVSAGLAGLAGALLGGVRGAVSPDDFVALASLLLLLVLRLGGSSTVTGALAGAYFVASSPQLQERFPEVPALPYLVTGLAVLLVGRDPHGLGGLVSRTGERLRATRRTAGVAGG